MLSEVMRFIFELSIFVAGNFFIAWGSKKIFPSLKQKPLTTIWGEISLVVGGTFFLLHSVYLWIFKMYT